MPKSRLKKSKSFIISKGSQRATDLEDLPEGAYVYEEQEYIPNADGRVTVD